MSRLNRFAHRNAEPFRTVDRAYAPLDVVPGTDGDDLLYGTDGDDTIDGGKGDDALYGQLGNDSLLGSAGYDNLSGEDGNDTLVGGNGSDDLFGGAGDDVLQGGSNIDNLFGGDGADRLVGGSERDLLQGNAGNDTLDGGSGVDRAYYSFTGLSGVTFSAAVVSGNGVAVNLDAGDFGIDRLVNVEAVYLYGTPGADNFTGSGGDDYLYGEEGNDTLMGGGGADFMRGGAGDDSMVGGTGADFAWYDFGPAGSAVAFDASILNGTGSTVVLDGGIVGQDTLSGIEYLTIYGSSFNDTLAGSGGSDRIYSAAGNDSVRGGVGNDYIAGSSGLDTLLGGVGNDSLEAGSGGFDDVIAGGSGTDTFVIYLRGDAGVQFDAAVVGTADQVSLADGAGGIDSLNSMENVLIYATEFDDTMTGSAGNDTLFGDAGDDWLTGGAGNDTAEFDFWRATSGVVFNASAVGGAGTVVFDTVTEGTDTLIGIEAIRVWGSEYGDRITGSIGGDELWAGSGADKVTGGPGDDTLSGFTESDQLSGGTGNDSLSGGSEDDTLAGGGGSDTLEGGTGADRFLFDSGPALPGNADVLRDFRSGQDRILLDDAVFKTVGAAGVLAAGKFVAGTAALDSFDRVIYDSATGHLFYDVDGVGGTDQVLVATLKPGAALAVDDIWVV